MARMHELASASPPYEFVPNILRYTFNSETFNILFIIYPLNGYFTIDSAPTISTTISTTISKTIRHSILP